MLAILKGNCGADAGFQCYGDVTRGLDHVAPRALPCMHFLPRTPTWRPRLTGASHSLASTMLWKLPYGRSFRSLPRNRSNNRRHYVVLLRDGALDDFPLLQFNPAKNECPSTE